MDKLERRIDAMKNASGGKKRLPFHVISVSDVVPLRLLVDIVQNDDGRHEVSHLAGRQLINVRSAILAAIPVHPVELELFAGRRLHFCDVINAFHVGRSVQDDRPAVEEHFQRALLVVVRARLGAGGEKEQKRANLSADSLNCEGKSTGRRVVKKKNMSETLNSTYPCFSV